jgi:hypothetical protein
VQHLLHIRGKHVRNTYYIRQISTAIESNAACAIAGRPLGGQ